MVYEELVSSMQEAAEQNNRETIERAARQAVEIISDAEKQAAEIRRRQMEERIRQAEVERNRQTYLATEEVKTATSHVKEQLLHNAFDAAAEELSGIRSEPGYAALFERLLTEAVHEVRGKECIFRIDPRDRDLCNRIIQDHQFSGIIKPDLETAGGLVVCSSDERIMVHNTIESRLDRAKDVYRMDILQELTGG